MRRVYSSAWVSISAAGAVVTSAVSGTGEEDFSDSASSCGKLEINSSISSAGMSSNSSEKGTIDSVINLSRISVQKEYASADADSGVCMRSEVGDEKSEPDEKSRIEAKSRGGAETESCARSSVGSKSGSGIMLRNLAAQSTGAAVPLSMQSSHISLKSKSGQHLFNDTQQYPLVRIKDQSYGIMGIHTFYRATRAYP